MIENRIISRMVSKNKQKYVGNNRKKACNEEKVKKYQKNCKIVLTKRKTSYILNTYLRKKFHIDYKSNERKVQTTRNLSKVLRIKPLSTKDKILTVVL